MAGALPNGGPGVALELGARPAILRVRPGLRRIIYTTNAIESLNFHATQGDEGRGHFPSDEAALQTGLTSGSAIWRRSGHGQPKCWNLALNQFSIMFEGRLPA